MGFSSAMDSAIRRRLIIFNGFSCLCGAVVLAVLGVSFQLLISYFAGYDTYHECRVAMA